MTGIWENGIELTVLTGSKVALSDKILFCVGTGAFLMSFFNILDAAFGFLSGNRRVQNKGERETTKGLLSHFIGYGFLMILSGLTVGGIFFCVNPNKALMLIPAILSVFGLALLFIAWHIRQGLLHNWLIRLSTVWITIYKGFLFLLVWWFILYAYFLNSKEVNTFILSGIILMIVSVSIYLIVKLKKIKND